MDPRDMNDEHDKRPVAGDTLPDALRWQLRDLRRDQAPARDMWPDIVARLADHSQGSRLHDTRHPHESHHPRDTLHPPDTRHPREGGDPDWGHCRDESLGSRLRGNDGERTTTRSSVDPRLRGDDGKKQVIRGFRAYVPAHWAVPAALAATLILALGFLGWEQGMVGDQRATPSTFAAVPSDTEPTLVQREAAGMTRQYQAALVELDGMQPDTPPGATLALQPAFEELDRSASLILDALARDPDSRLLLQQLQRTYAHRLALAQRAVIS